MRRLLDANNHVTIRSPRVAVSRMRPTNVTRVVVAGSSAFVPDSSALLQAPIPGHLRCRFGPGGNSTAEACERLSERLRDEAPADGEPYRTNDRFFTGGTGPLAGLAPFVLGATPAGQVIVPAGADAFTIALLRAAQHAVLGPARDPRQHRPDRGGRGRHRGHHAADRHRRA